jgi:hypothetical protein
MMADENGVPRWFVYNHDCHCSNRSSVTTRDQYQAFFRKQIEFLVLIEDDLVG